MTAPAFDPTQIHSHTYYVEDLAHSTSESRQCYFEAALWSIVGRPDGQPVTGASGRRFWTNIPAAAADFQSDDRYDTTVEYDFVEYSPNPNANLPPDASWPYGERRERVVKTLKGADELKALVRARQVEVNEALWPGDAIAQRSIVAALYREKSQRSVIEQAYLDDFDLRAAAMGHNELVKDACFAAIEANEAFSLETGTADMRWTTSVDEQSA